jgi:hypothetical protein
LDINYSIHGKYYLFILYLVIILSLPILPIELKLAIFGNNYIFICLDFLIRYIKYILILYIHGYIGYGNAIYLFFMFGPGP